jgi:hypothetical protein
MSNFSRLFFRRITFTVSMIASCHTWAAVAQEIPPESKIARQVVEVQAGSLALPMATRSTEAELSGTAMRNSRDFDFEMLETPEQPHQPARDFDFDLNS